MSDLTANQKGVDVLVVTALQMEHEAARDAAKYDLGREQGVHQWLEHGDEEAPYLYADYAIGRHSLSVALARPTRMGANATIPLAATLVERLRPQCIAMCGVCAGNPGDVTLGDVIVAEMTYFYDEGKSKPDGFQGDHRQTPMQDRWVRAAQDFSPVGLPSYATPTVDDARDWLLERLYAKEDPLGHLSRPRYFPEGVWAERIEGYVKDGFIRRTGLKLRLTKKGGALVKDRLFRLVDGPSKLPFAIKVGPIATGNVVVKDGITWGRLAQLGVRGVLGLEMEAAGIAGLAHRNAVPSWIVVKGVMDYADPRKDDRHKRFAARASAEVLFSFLARQIVLAKSTATPTPRVAIAPETPCATAGERTSTHVIDGTIWMSGELDTLDGRFTAEITLRFLAPGVSLTGIELLCVDTRGIPAWAQEQRAWVVKSADVRTELGFATYSDLAQVHDISAPGMVVQLVRAFRPRLPVQYPYEWDRPGTCLGVRVLAEAADGASTSTTTWFRWSGARHVEAVSGPSKPPRLVDAELDRLEKQGFLRISERMALQELSETDRYLVFCYPEHYQGASPDQYQQVLLILESLRKRLDGHPKPPFVEGRTAARLEFELAAHQREVQLPAAPRSPETIRVTVHGFEQEHEIHGSTLRVASDLSFSVSLVVTMID